MDFKNDLKAYSEELSECLKRTDWGILSSIGEKLVSSKASGSRVWLFGNGGSAATASHVTNDLVKGCRVEDRVGFPAMCLSDSSTVLTCLANDFSYADVYAVLLSTHAKRETLPSRLGKRKLAKCGQWTGKSTGNGADNDWIRRTRWR